MKLLKDVFSWVAGGVLGEESVVLSIDGFGSLAMNWLISRDDSNY